MTQKVIQVPALLMTVVLWFRTNFGSSLGAAGWATAMGPGLVIVVMVAAGIMSVLIASIVKVATRVHDGTVYEEARGSGIAGPTHRLRVLGPWPALLSGGGGVARVLPR